MGNYGIKVMKPGKDISSTVPQDHIFSSLYTTVKIISDNMGTITVPSGGAYGTISHNLGYVPLIALYTELTPNSDRWYYGFPSTQNENTYFDDGVVGTAFGVFHLVNTTGSSKNIRYHYFVFGDLK